MKKEKQQTAVQATAEEKTTAVQKTEPKKKSAGNDKPNGFVRFFRAIGRFFKKIGRKFKEIFKELKKVTWPSFGKVVKETGVVLAVCLFFLVILTVFDLGLGELVKLVTSIGK